MLKASKSSRRSRQEVSPLHDQQPMPKATKQSRHAGQHVSPVQEEQSVADDQCEDGLQDEIPPSAQPTVAVSRKRKRNLRFDHFDFDGGDDVSTPSEFATPNQD